MTEHLFFSQHTNTTHEHTNTAAWHIPVDQSSSVIGFLLKWDKDAIPTLLFKKPEKLVVRVSFHNGFKTFSCDETETIGQFRAYVASRRLPEEDDHANCRIHEHIEDKKGRVVEVVLSDDIYVSELVRRFPCDPREREKHNFVYRVPDPIAPEPARGGSTKGARSYDPAFLKSDVPGGFHKALVLEAVAVKGNLRRVELGRRHAPEEPAPAPTTYSQPPLRTVSEPQAVPPAAQTGDGGAANAVLSPGVPRKELPPCPGSAPVPHKALPVPRPAHARASFNLSLESPRGAQGAAVPVGTAVPAAVGTETPAQQQQQEDVPAVVLQEQAVEAAPQPTPLPVEVAPAPAQAPEPQPAVVVPSVAPLPLPVAPEPAPVAAVPVTPLPAPVAPLPAPVPAAATVAPVAAAPVTPLPAPMPAAAPMPAPVAAAPLPAPVQPQPQQQPQTVTFVPLTTMPPFQPQMAQTLNAGAPMPTMTLLPPANATNLPPAAPGTLQLGFQPVFSFNPVALPPLTLTPLAPNPAQPAPASASAATLPAPAPAPST